MAQTETVAGVETLFRPFRVGSLEMKNRIVMAPMTRNQAPEGVPGAANAEYYRKRAEGSVGLILSEGTVVDRPASRNLPNVPFFHGAAALGGWKDVIDTVHAAGGKMGPQIWHTGSTRGSRGWEPGVEVESPSGIVKPEDPRGRAMSEEDIADTIAAFARAAAEAEKLGFDMAEVHGAHGYLLDQFLWEGTNTRADGWGGPTLPERTRIMVELIKAIRAAVSPDFPIFLRLSQWKQQDYEVKLATTPDEMTAWLAPLAEAGVDVFHCSQRRFWVPEFPELDGEDGLNFAGWARKLTGVPTCSVGSVGLDGEFFRSFRGHGAGAAGIEKLLERMERDEFDLIAVGRILISDPYWVEKIRTGQDVSGFDAAALATLD
ncbi:1,2-oxophytodienoate reductase [Oceanicola sp. 22II-s10i]|uniref:NADH:flavin oxidoreductase n=1 Tax=Oceanicola sp. 22II-s10i TaxID=1317116 RepID=UPI000B529285|nr:NADH:flavin oxidoreductase [Oceanicola sp. 22II-s10i]OWU82976.1 1,2-oxophytodienoate reductase [Oceanicola sp. 22II-s10i]